MKNRFIGLIMLFGMISITGFAAHGDLTQDSDSKDIGLVPAFDCAEIQTISETPITIVPVDTVEVIYLLDVQASDPPNNYSYIELAGDDQGSSERTYRPNIGYLNSITNSSITAYSYVFNLPYMDKCSILDNKLKSIQNTYSKPKAILTYRRARDGLISSLA